MKRALLISASCIIVFLACKKENPAVPVTHLSKKEILVSKTWEVDELLHNVACENSHYIRGGDN
nr:hypothetical protein [Chitinophagaceae bacterium]